MPDGGSGVEIARVNKPILELLRRRDTLLHFIKTRPRWAETLLKTIGRYQSAEVYSSYRKRRSSFG